MDAVFYMTAADAFVDHSTDAPIAAVRFGERGFYPIYAPGDAQATVDRLNAKHGWTPEEVRAAHAGSMFGWFCPAAKPARDAVSRRAPQA